MDDARDPGPSTAPPAPSSAPPSPWWSRAGRSAAAGRAAGNAEGSGADTLVNGPSEDDRPQPDRPEVSAQAPYSQPQPGYAQPPYGQPSAQTEPLPSYDPWSRPTTVAGFPSGERPYGGPVDTLGNPVAAPARRRGLGTAAAVLATALLAGTAGGIAGANLSDEPNALTSPSASLGTGGSTTATVDRAPDSVAGIAARVMQSTVSIAVRAPGGNGTGSGVIISQEGYILTNNHVVETAADGGEITVTLDAAERELPADIVGLDPVTDLAVLRVRTDRSLPAASLGRSSALVIGDPVIAIGSPLGLSGTVTTGIVSALNRTVDVPSSDGSRNPLFNAIQTDAAINPGNSGGALVNATARSSGSTPRSPPSAAAAPAAGRAAAASASASPSRSTRPAPSPRRSSAPGGAPTRASASRPPR
jgi:putative serine protease PepD